MSAEQIYGTWDLKAPSHQDYLQSLWHMLAGQFIGTPQYQPNNALTQRKNEIIQLWMLYYYQQPKVVLEVGTAQGGTFASWCQLGREDAMLISIDRESNDCWPRPGNQVHPSIAKKAIGMTEEGGGLYLLGRMKQKVVSIKGWTYEQSTKDQLTEALKGREIDFLFHDASHEASMFEDDFQWMWPLVSEGGIFASHDVCRSDDPKCNKKEYWDWIKENVDYSACYEFKPSKDEQNMGIGVLIK